MSRVMLTAMTAFLALTATVFAQASVIEPGDTVEYGFREPIVNGMGASSLADFHGMPVLVEFWGHR